MKGETGWNWMHSVDIQQYLFVCLGPECSILDLYYSDFLCRRIWTGWDPKPQNVREESPPGAGNHRWWQIFPAYPNMQALFPFISLREIPAQPFPVDLHKPAKWKLCTKRDAFLRKAEGWCVFHSDPNAGWKLPSWTIHFRHMNKTYGLHMSCFNNCSEFPSSATHQPGFANTCVLQHVPVADCCGWLHILRK